MFNTRVGRSRRTAWRLYCDVAACSAHAREGGQPVHRYTGFRVRGDERAGHGAVMLMTPDELEAALRDIGARRYHRLHPFHGLLHSGQCTKGQVQAWALNRYYYQAMIPMKDASLIARTDNSALRREWRSRLHDHDGEHDGDGGIARWLRLTDGLGLDREYILSTRGILPGTRFAVEAYVHFVRDRPLLEAVASSLTELFSPVIIGERMAGMLANYPFVTRENSLLFRQASAASATRFRFRARLREAPCADREGAASGARGARIQMQRAVGAARRAVSRVCGAQACVAGCLRAGGSVMRSAPGMTVRCCRQVRTGNGLGLLPPLEKGRVGEGIKPVGRLWWTPSLSLPLSGGGDRMRTPASRRPAPLGAIELRR